MRAHAQQLSQESRASTRSCCKEQRKGFLDRLIARPSPRTAFATGLLLFAPGATFIAAVQVIATCDASVPVIVLALVIVVMITALVVWLPLVGYLAAPEATTRRLAVLNAWLRAHGRTVVIYALGVAGAVLIVDGALGLAGVTKPGARRADRTIAASPRAGDPPCPATPGRPEDRRPTGVHHQRRAADHAAQRVLGHDRADLRDRLDPARQAGQQRAAAGQPDLAPHDVLRQPGRDVRQHLLHGAPDGGHHRLERARDQLAGHLLQPRRPARGVEADRLRPAVLTAGEAELRP